MKKYVILLLVCLLLTGCASPSPAETTEHFESLTLYLPDDNAEKLETAVVTVPEISEATILEQLKAAEVLNGDVKINSFSKEAGALTIDFNAAFGQLVGSMGTAGETMILGSVVNTFLTAFDAETVSITVDGSILETGHNIYDMPLGFYE